MDKKGNGMWMILLVMLAAIFIASKWESWPFIKNSVNAVLNPTFGVILNWNVYVGFLVVMAVTSLILTLAQKYFSDQKELSEIKKEQKFLQAEMKKYREHPEKMLELQKKQLEFFPKTMHLTMQPMIYTAIPIILLFKWFSDYLHPIFGGWWILYYLIGAIIFSSIFRKMFNVA